MIEKATYSYSKVMECMNLVKEQSWTVSRKNCHFAKAVELKKVFEFCFEKTGCLLFDWGWNPLEDYYNHSYNFKDYTKKELDKELNAVKRFLQREIYSIFTLIQNEEVNVIP